MTDCIDAVICWSYNVHNVATKCYYKIAKKEQRRVSYFYCNDSVSQLRENELGTLINSARINNL